MKTYYSEILQRSVTVPAHSDLAKAELNGLVEEARQFLSLLDTELEKYESLQQVHYGHVGDLQYVTNELTKIMTFMTEKES